MDNDRYFKEVRRRKPLEKSAEDMQVFRAAMFKQFEEK